MTTTRKIGETFYLICGATCLTIAGIAAFGAAFSSIGAAALILFGVDIPLIVGLFGLSFAPELKIFQYFICIGALVAIGLILSVYIQDLKVGAPQTSFIRDPWSWFYLAPNIILLASTAIRLKHRVKI